MRVIAGQFRSRPLSAPRGNNTRPTSDRLRETLFNVLGPRIGGARFADLYAGSGAVGIEALSRGAQHCLLVEQAPPAIAAIRRNLADLKISTGVTLATRTVHRTLSEWEQGSFDIVFLDPPYEAAAEYAGTLRQLADNHKRLLAPEAIVIAEHARRSPLEAQYDFLQRTRVLEQGDAALSFYAIAQTEAED